MSKFFDIFSKGKRKKECFNSFKVKRVENLSENHPSASVIFKHYQFDSDCCDAGAPARAQRNTLFSPFASETEKDYHSGSGEMNSVFSKNDFSCAINQKQSSSQENCETKKQMYIIQISNSKNFHIGPQKTINICASQQLRNNAESCALPCTEDSSAMSETDLSRLLDCEQKLREDYLIEISMHLGRSWKEFGRSLGLEETFLQEQEFHNGTNKILLVYDMLHDYVTRYPNTSFGFVIYVLSETNQFQIIQRLAQILKTSSVPGLTPLSQ